MDFEFTRGDTKIFKFKLQNKNGENLILSSGDNLYFTVKKSANSKNVSFQKTLGKGINLENDGYYYVTIDSNDTANLNYGTYGYDIELKTLSGIVKTLIIGSITITEEYTFEGDEI